jgi:AcrR family transcriptional regulator
MEAKMSTELEKRNIRRMSNKESNRITKECICDALIGLMKEHPYKDINMTMIIKKSGASRASVYRNYPSKEAIIQDITKNITDELSASLTGVLQKSNTYEWFLKVFSRLHSDKDMCVLIRNSNISFTDMFYNALCIASDSEYASQHEYIARGIAAGLWEVSLTWIKNGMKESPEYMAEVCSETLRLE